MYFTSKEGCVLVRNAGLNYRSAVCYKHAALHARILPFERHTTSEAKRKEASLFQIEMKQLMCKHTSLHSFQWHILEEKEERNLN